MKEFMNKVTQFMNKITNTWVSWSKRTKIVVSITAILAITIGVYSISTPPRYAPRFTVPYTVSELVHKEGVYSIKFVAPDNKSDVRGLKLSATEVNEAALRPHIRKMFKNDDIGSVLALAYTADSNIVSDYEKLELKSKVTQLHGILEEICFASNHLKLTPTGILVIFVDNNVQAVIRYDGDQLFSVSYDRAVKKYVKANISEFNELNNTNINPVDLVKKLNERLDKE